jgi:hypothetical protein
MSQFCQAIQLRLNVSADGHSLHGHQWRSLIQIIEQLRTLVWCTENIVGHAGNGVVRDRDLVGPLKRDEGHRDVHRGA